MNPPSHPPSVCPSANLSPFHLPHTETRQWGPHPSSVFTTFMPPLGHSLTTGAPVSVFCTSFPHLFIILLYKHPLFPTFVFVVPVGDLLSCLGHTPPMSPLVGVSLLIFPYFDIVHIFRASPRSLTIILCIYLLCPASGTTYLGSCRPHDTRSCLNSCGHALYHPSSNQGQSGVFPLFGFIYIPLPPHTISRFHGVPFASGSRVTFLSTSAHFSKRATVSWSSFPI
jgi:hypothetical protein